MIILKYLRKFTYKVNTKNVCYFCFNDPVDSQIIWFVPISSKVDKYKTIYTAKLKSKKKVYNFYDCGGSLRTAPGGARLRSSSLFC